jgi:hypothetical protein
MEQQESSINAVLTEEEYINNWAIRQCSRYYLCTNTLQLQFRSLEEPRLLTADLVYELRNQNYVFFS